MVGSCVGAAAGTAMANAGRPSTTPVISVVRGREGYLVRVAACLRCLMPGMWMQPCRCCDATDRDHACTARAFRSRASRIRVDDQRVVPQARRARTGCIMDTKANANDSQY